MIIPPRKNVVVSYDWEYLGLHNRAECVCVQSYSWKGIWIPYGHWLEGVYKRGVGMRASYTLVAAAIFEQGNIWLLMMMMLNCMHSTVSSVYLLVRSFWTVSSSCVLFVYVSWIRGISGLLWRILWWNVPIFVCQSVCALSAGLSVYMCVQSSRDEW